MASADFRSLARNDKRFLVLGALVFVASLLPWRGWSYHISSLGQTVSDSWSENAWRGLAALGLVLMLAATLVVAVQLLGSAAKLPDTPVSWNVIVVGLDALGALFIVISSFSLPAASIPGGSYGLRWGGWVLMIVAVAQVAVGLMRFRESGEPGPWAPHEAP